MKFNPFSFCAYLLLLPVLLLNTACEKEAMFDCLKSTGPIKTETRQLEAFNTLLIEDNVNVWIVPDTQTYVELKAGRNLLANIKTKISNGKLTISNINQCNWVRDYDKPIEAWVHTPVVLNLVLSGTGNLKSTAPLNIDTVFLHINGSGDMDLAIHSNYVWVGTNHVGNMYLSGTNDLLIANIGGYGKLKSFNFKNNTVFIQMKDAGPAEVFANKQVGVHFSANGSGNVIYKGSPATAEKGGPGTGKIIKAD